MPVQKSLETYWTNKIFKNRILNLNIPDEELNVKKIHKANNFKKTTTIGHIKIIDLYPSC